MSENTHAVEEPLVESAPLAHRMAATLCGSDPDTGSDCAWYHGSWQFWRAMGLAPTSGGQAAFFVDTIRGLAATGRRPDVLVSGCADYSIPAHVLRAYEVAGAPVRLTALDRCETPLYLTRWYAARRGVAVTTSRGDARDYESPAPFDVIVANSFLGYFDVNARRRLFTRWHGLLRPGGMLVLTNRVRPGAGTGLVGFAPDEAEAFIEAARRAVDRWRDVFGFDADEVVGWARVYTERFRSHPVRSQAEIEAGLRDTGFQIERLEVATADGRAGAPLSGPSTLEKAEHARLVATRR